ncbi:MAG: hypothetical protein NTZ03_01305 [Actinobacteria bacterium]|nr:hypothetical protein [Actinomycetota bacterium]
MSGDREPDRVDHNAFFDAVVGAVAREHDLALVTRNTRARSVCQALGVELLIVP